METPPTGSATMKGRLASGPRKMVARRPRGGGDEKTGRSPASVGDSAASEVDGAASAGDEEASVA